jgi:hypothetical protein
VELVRAVVARATLEREALATGGLSAPLGVSRQDSDEYERCCGKDETADLVHAADLLSLLPPMRPRICLQSVGVKWLEVASSSHEEPHQPHPDDRAHEQGGDK